MPKTGAAPDLSNFPYVNEDLAGIDAWSYSVPMDTDSRCANGEEEFELEMVVHALAGENCDPYNGTYIWMTDFDMFAVQETKDDKVSEVNIGEGHNYAYLKFPVACDCGVKPNPKPRPGELWRMRNLA